MKNFKNLKNDRKNALRVLLGTCALVLSPLAPSNAWAQEPAAAQDHFGRMAKGRAADSLQLAGRHAEQIRHVRNRHCAVMPRNLLEARNRFIRRTIAALGEPGMDDRFDRSDNGLIVRCCGYFTEQPVGQIAP